MPLPTAFECAVGTGACFPTMVFDPMNDEDVGVHGQRLFKTIRA